MWLYNDKPFDELESNGFEGFVYCITDDNGRRYIGRKAFTHRNKVALSKKARVGTRKRVEIRQKDSGWKDYWGSSKDFLAYIQENGTENFRREILKLCENKQSLSYWEAHYMFQEGVLFSDDFWNGNVLGKFFKGKIHK
jgi:hypothetical protein